MKLFAGALATAIFGFSLVSTDAVAEETEGPTILAHCGGCGTGAAPQHKHTTKVKNALNDPKGTLAKILKHHVIAKKVDAGDITKEMQVETLAGKKITLKPLKGTVVVNGKSKVIKASIQSDNGVIHIIDSVLLP